MAFFFLAVEEMQFFWIKLLQIFFGENYKFNVPLNEISFFFFFEDLGEGWEKFRAKLKVARH